MWMMIKGSMKIVSEALDVSHVYACCFQEVSRVQSELANLNSEIEMQKEILEAKNEEMMKIREQIEQVTFSLSV